MFRQLGAGVTAAALFISSTAFAASDVNQGALKPGKPATVKQAEFFDGRDHALLLVGAGVVIGGIVLVATGNSHGSLGSFTCPAFCNPSTSTTTSTTTTPVTTTTTTTTTTTGTTP